MADVPHHPLEDGRLRPVPKPPLLPRVLWAARQRPGHRGQLLFVQLCGTQADGGRGRRGSDLCDVSRRHRRNAVLRRRRLRPRESRRVDTRHSVDEGRPDGFERRGRAAAFESAARRLARPQGNGSGGGVHQEQTRGRGTHHESFKSQSVARDAGVRLGVRRALAGRRHRLDSRHPNEAGVRGSAVLQLLAARWSSLHASCRAQQGVHHVGGGG